MSFYSEGQTASFTYQSANGTFCTPTTVNFSQTSTGNPLGYTWNFGNGQFSNAANPTTIYATPGTYTIKMVAVFQSQALETTQTIVINPSITATLSANRNYICTPGNINFTASSTGNIANYIWDFGDGRGNVTTATPTVNHNYTDFGIFTAIVTATDVSGCRAQASYSITVQNPPVTGAVSPLSGCIPALINFSSSVTVPVGGSVANYSWDFGDGSPAVNTATNSITHSYIAVGTYLPVLTITTNEGCTNTYAYQAIAFGTPPTNHTAYSMKSVYCGSETAVFVSTAINANSWFWNYGDGTSQTVTDTITQHKYASLGTKTVIDTPYFNGCAGTPISFQIDVVGVIAGFLYTNTCSAKTTFSFTNTTQGNQSTIVWNFGDGSPTSSSLNVSHTYPSSGAFLTTLTVTDNITGCSDIFGATIFTATPSLTNPDTSICRNSNTVFTIPNNYTNATASYNWNVVGLPAIINNNNPFTPTASIFGNFPLNYIVINNGAQYCLDTIYLNHPIRVRGPNLNFTTPVNVCANKVYNVTNTSSAYFPADSVSLWYWNYGIAAVNDTIFQPAGISSPGPGIYNIKLVAKDITGCIDSLTKQVTINPIPFLHIIPRNDTLCMGKKDSLIAFHSDNILWSPPALVSCATCDTVLANPTATTLFFATSTNTVGCITRDSSLITVYVPFTASPILTPVYICQKDTVQINAGPPAKKITWSPASTLSDANNYNPLASPSVTTAYTALLTDSAGCFSSSTTINVIVNSLPAVNAGPDKILPYNASFILSPNYSSNVVSYNWTPAGTLNCIACPQPGGVALQKQAYTINVKSDSGCVAKDDITVFVECNYANLFMPGAFSPNTDMKNDVYYPLTRGIKLIAELAIYNRYGQLVFEAKNFKPNDKTFGWDGKLRGQNQPVDSYVYMMEAICELGERITKKGSFLLLR